MLTNNFQQRFDRMYSRSEALSADLGVDLEDYAAKWLTMNLGLKDVQLNQVFSDPERSVHPQNTQFDIDICSMNSTIIMECTSILKSISKLDKFIQKRDALSRNLNKKLHAYFRCFKIDEDILSEELSFMTNAEAVQMFTGSYSYFVGPVSKSLLKRT